MSGASDMVTQLAKELQPLKAAIHVGVGRDPAGLQIGMAKLIEARMTAMLREATNFVNEGGSGQDLSFTKTDLSKLLKEATTIAKTAAHVLALHAIHMHLHRRSDNRPPPVSVHWLIPVYQICGDDRSIQILSRIACEFVCFLACARKLQGGKP